MLNESNTISVMSEVGQLDRDEKYYLILRYNFNFSLMCERNKRRIIEKYLLTTHNHNKEW